MATIVFVPSRGYLFFYSYLSSPPLTVTRVFVPSRGYLFFYNLKITNKKNGAECFRPLSGLSLFLLKMKNYEMALKVFVPSRGYLFFYSVKTLYL